MTPSKLAVFERMILHHHGQPLLARIERRALGNRPGLQRAADFQPEIVMQMRGVMPLDAKLQRERAGSAAASPRSGLRRPVEMALFAYTF